MEYLAITAIVIAVILGGVTTILGLLLNNTQMKLKQALAQRCDEPPQSETDAKLARLTEELRRAESDFEQPIKAGDVVLFRLTLFSDRLSSIRLTGHKITNSPKDVSFDSVLEGVHPDDRSMLRNSLIDSVTRQRPIELVYRVMDQGQERYYHLRAKTVPGREPAAVDLLGAVAEITSLINAHREQSESLRTLEEIQELSPFGIWAVGPDNVMTVWNPAMEKMTGIPSDKVIGFAINTIQNQVFPEMVRVPAEGETPTRVYRTSITFEDGTRHFRVARVVTENDGFPSHTFGIVDWETQGSSSTRSVEMETLGRLTAGFAHNFANLIQIVMGYTDIVMQDLNDGQKSTPALMLDDIGQIQGAAVKADELVRQMLAFCSPDSLNSTRCELNQVVRRFIGLARRVLGEDTVVRFHPQHETAHALSDPGIVERIVLRLVLRLKETLPEGGVVALSTAAVTVDPDWPMGDLEPGDYVKLSISTNTTGWGREPQDHDGADNATVAQMLASVGGSLNLHESPDLGTTVSLYFKAAPATVTAATDNEIPLVDRDQLSSGAARIHHNGRHSILVVEDDAPVRRLTAKALSMAGYDVIEAADGNEALSVFNADPERIDLLITDVIMPGLNGRQVADELRQYRPELPVLFCSGYSSDLLKNEYMLNIQGLVIQKPYRSTDLIAAAARLLNSPSARTHETTDEN